MQEKLKRVGERAITLLFFIFALRISALRDGPDRITFIVPGKPEASGWLLAAIIASLIVNASTQDVDRKQLADWIAALCVCAIVSLWVIPSDWAALAKLMILVPTCFAAIVGALEVSKHHRNHHHA